MTLRPPDHRFVLWVDDFGSGNWWSMPSNFFELNAGISPTQNKLPPSQCGCNGHRTASLDALISALGRPLHLHHCLCGVVEVDLLRASTQNHTGSCCVAHELGEASTRGGRLPRTTLAWFFTCIIAASFSAVSSSCMCFFAPSSLSFSSCSSTDMSSWTAGSRLLLSGLEVGQSLLNSLARTDRDR
jgi:hypothetical protein